MIWNLDYYIFLKFIYRKRNIICLGAVLIHGFKSLLHVLACVHAYVWSCLTVAHQAPLSMGFSQQEFYSRFLLSILGDLSNPVIQPTSLVSPTLAGKFFNTEPLGKPIYIGNAFKNIQN